MGFAPDFVADALSIPAQSPLRARLALLSPFTAVVSDSRGVVPGCLFVALRGDRVDGHTYIAEAVKAGATAVVCEPGRGTAAGFQFEVSDTLVAYRELAKKWRARFAQIPVVAVAGAVGKTTTKEMLSAALLGKYARVLKTIGSQNGYVGIPMTLLALRPEHEAAVIEIGIDAVGAMARHLDAVQPTAALVTAIAEEHLENLHDLETVAREECLALSVTARSPGGFAAIRSDDLWVQKETRGLVAASTAKVVRFGFQTAEGSTLPADVLGGLRQTVSGKPTLVVTTGSDRREFQLLLPGLHNARNQLAAIVVARGLGLTDDEIERGFSQNFKTAPGRTEISDLELEKKEVRFYRDYYNASPSSMAAALTLLLEGRDLERSHWACLGDMLELGQSEERLHRALADFIIGKPVEGVLLYGARMRWLLDELQRRNYVGQLFHFASHAELAQSLRFLLKLHPTVRQSVLIKGSRGMKMEEVWKAIGEK